MTAGEALAFVRTHGIVLASARGPVPRLAEAIVGAPIKGSWWAHPDSRRIYAIFEQLADSPDLLICRLVEGKVTFVHRRLWPALARLASEFQPDRICQVRQEHTPSGRHVNHEVPFPQWVPPEVMGEARALTEQQARDALRSVLTSNPVGSKSTA
ncbi:MAG TPA: hypothetical protein VGY49_14385 [Burkholderiaceae bacterium]|nr:hypothetical protein [Burkholderiaceae bacterium]